MQKEKTIRQQYQQLTNEANKAQGKLINAINNHAPQSEYQNAFDAFKQAEADRSNFYKKNINKNNQ